MVSFRRSMPLGGVGWCPSQHAPTEEKTEATWLRSPLASQAENGLVAPRAGPPERHPSAHHSAVFAARCPAPAALHGIRHALPTSAPRLAPRDPATAHHRAAHDCDHPNAPASALDARARSLRHREFAGRTARRRARHSVSNAARRANAAGDECCKRRLVVPARASMGASGARPRTRAPRPRRREPAGPRAGAPSP